MSEGRSDRDNISEVDEDDSHIKHLDNRCPLCGRDPHSQITDTQIIAWRKCLDIQFKEHKRDINTLAKMEVKAEQAISGERLRPQVFCWYLRHRNDTETNQKGLLADEEAWYKAVNAAESRKRALNRSLQTLLKRAKPDLPEKW